MLNWCGKWGRRCFGAVMVLISVQHAWAGEVTVSAAASLTNAFKDIAQIYQTHYPDAKVNLNFAASGALLQQIAKGAPVDVFASADQETMDAAEKQGLIVSAGRHDFAHNRLVLIVPTDSQFAFKQLQDLNQVAVKRIALGLPASVPVGRYAVQAMSAAKLWPALENKMISTQNVRQSLDYVARGEVDAGFVYASDATILRDKIKVAFEISLDSVIAYPIAPIKDSKHSEEAKRFIQFVSSAAGQAILVKYGFLKP
ncbi:molybdate ABC transporter substrate-binding protein [Undibacterium fentianense]|uniref:Molybdate ABC transporter substrate-binding protein n=1 Tax=Undibacterium fentianense TaxID=2828728 RepID=A0A941IDZ1_9BURK|nr:molybdate ABC transporter substrate-binding protein [Undibacterium fentianense]MBR7800508.1 molybdate ABC transporter substrate-binding protein [Undibacterium fentianense]